jgi:hypothetical protein
VNPILIIQTAEALAALGAQVLPLIEQGRAALASNDEAQLQAFLTKVQKTNDALGAA